MVSSTIGKTVRSRTSLHKIKAFDSRRTKEKLKLCHPVNMTRPRCEKFHGKLFMRNETQLYTSLEGHSSRQNQKHTSVGGNDLPKGAICLTRNKGEGGNDFCHNHKSNNLYSRSEKKVNRMRECTTSNTNYRLEEISHGQASTTRLRQFHKGMRGDGMSSITRGERHHSQSDCVKSENIVPNPLVNKFTMPSLERPPSERHTLGNPDEDWKIA